MNTEKIESAIGQLQGALTTLRNAREGLSRNIAAIREDENACSMKIAELRRMPISIDDFGVYLKHHIKFLGEKWFAERASHRIVTPRTGEIAKNKDAWASFENEDGTFIGSKYFMPERAELDSGNPFESLCFFMPELVAEKLLAAYKKQLSSQWGNEGVQPVEERRTLIADLCAQGEKLRVKREALEAELSELTGGMTGVTAATVAPQAAAPQPAMQLKGQRMVNPDLVSQR